MYWVQVMQTRKIVMQLCLYSEYKIPWVDYAAKWEQNKLPEQGIVLISYIISMYIVGLHCKNSRPQ